MVAHSSHYSIWSSAPFVFFVFLFFQISCRRNDIRWFCLMVFENQLVFFSCICLPWTKIGWIANQPHSQSWLQFLIEFSHYFFLLAFVPRYNHGAVACQKLWCIRGCSWCEKSPRAACSHFTRGRHHMYNHVIVALWPTNQKRLIVMLLIDSFQFASHTSYR